MRQMILCLGLLVGLAGAAHSQGTPWSNLAPEGLASNPVLIIDGAGGCPCTDGSPEGEANCGIPTDTFNGGCNSAPVVTSPISPNAPVCGTAEYANIQPATRDTDWYEYTVTTAGDFTWRVEAEFPSNLFILDAVCPPSLLGSDATTGCGDPGEVTLFLAPGTYRFFVAPDFTGPFFACGAEYTATLVGAPSILEVPAVSTMGLALIAVVLGGFAIYRLRRRAA